MDQRELNLISGRIDVGGEVIQFTRHEAMIVYMIMNGKDGTTMSEMMEHVFKEQASRNIKTISVHIFNIRKRIAHCGVGIVYDSVNNRYKMVTKNV